MANPAEHVAAIGPTQVAAIGLPSKSAAKGEARAGGLRIPSGQPLPQAAIAAQHAGQLPEVQKRARRTRWSDSLSCAATRGGAGVVLLFPARVV